MNTWQNLSPASPDNGQRKNYVSACAERAIRFVPGMRDLRRARLGLLSLMCGRKVILVSLDVRSLPEPWHPACGYLSIDGFCGRKANTMSVLLP